MSSLPKDGAATSSVASDKDPAEISAEAEAKAAARRLEKLGSILDVAKAMTVERDLDSLLTLILEEAKRVVQADRCTIFILDTEAGLLWSRIAQGLKKKEIRMPVGQGVAGWVARNDAVLNIPDAYADERFNKSVDHATGYQTRNILCVPMRGAGGELVGCVQALNRAGEEPFSEEDVELLLALGGQAAAAIQNTLLHESIEKLFEGVVKASVVAIESRDPTTSGHSERVADLTCCLAETVNDTNTGPYGSTHISQREMKELRYAGLLHDFGKVVVREHVLVKSTKLLGHEMEMLRLRFDLLKASLEREHYKAMTAPLEGAAQADGDSCRDELARRLEEVDEMWKFVEQCNRPAVLEQDGFERLQEIGKVDFRVADEPRYLLTSEEVEVLSVPRGSLSAEERAEIESHVSYTFRFLSQIPWTNELGRVPEIAYAHHEKLDGKGYPRGLGAEQIPLGSRIMAIADIYDALTATDRPYKKAVPHDKAVSILNSDAERGVLDPELVRLFVETGVPGRALEEQKVPPTPHMD